MRLSVLPIALAGAGLAAVQVSASPLRVVVVTSHQEVSSNLRFGHGAPESNGPHPIAHFVQPNRNDMNMENHEIVEPIHGAGRHHLCSLLKDKAIGLADKFRSAFGFAPIGTHSAEEDHSNDRISILPFIGTPVTVHATKPNTETDDSDNGVVSGPHPPPRPGMVHILPVGYDGANMRMVHHHAHHHRLRGAFLARMHRALMSLGPWEGRAVAFVLGCGIGVLLRMLFVIAIVTARAIRGSSSSTESEEEYAGEYQHVIFDRDADEIVVAPPQYTDEKVALVAADAEQEDDKNRA